ncbi:MAG: helix-turn-helix domain-containing protein [Acidobacteriota bacterium]
MKKTKKNRLEHAGWRFGSASDFLGLTPEEEAFVAVKLALAQSLKRRRQRKRLTQIELAKLLKSSQSRVAKMEAGDPSVSIDLLVRSLLVLGASPKELAQIIGGLSLSPAV